MGLIKVKLQSPTSMYSDYWTDLDNVKLVIQTWAQGDLMSSPKIRWEDLDYELDDLGECAERIRSRHDPRPPHVNRTWLTSSWVQIGVNIEGSKILVDYTTEYLREHYHSPDNPSVEEIVNHITLAKEMYPECSLWSPEAWRVFPLSESPMDLRLPF